MRLSLSVPDDFEFRSAITSHGFFVLAPNRWDPVRATLETTITLDEVTAVTVRIRQPVPGRVTVSGGVGVPRLQREAIRRAVVRMLRIDEDLSAFHARCRRSATHALAAKMRFGRLLRGASLFEDMVKVICTCNVTWGQTVRMVELLVSRYGVPSNVAGRCGFPTPARLAAVKADELRAEARVGYRAVSLQRLAAGVEAGALDLQAIDAHGGSSDEVFRRFRRVHGIGDYAAGHLCMLLGCYDRLAIDSETLRFLKACHPRRHWTPASIRRYYEGWHPYQFLAYWFELWQDYTHRHGPAEQWSPASTGIRITRPR